MVMSVITGPGIAGNGVPYKNASHTIPTTADTFAEMAITTLERDAGNSSHSATPYYDWNSYSPSGNL
jgi:hypothetical protein